MHFCRQLSLKSFLLSFFLLLLSTPTIAQHRRSEKKTVIKTHIEYSLDTVVQKIEDMEETFNTINAFRRKQLDSARVLRRLSEINATLASIRNQIGRQHIREYKRLLLDEYLLQDIKAQLSDWRAQLFEFNKNLIKMNAETVSFERDSILRTLINDSAYSEMYRDEISRLIRKWQEARQTTTTILASINRLQSAIASPYFETVDLLDVVDNDKNQVADKLFKREYAYLWNAQGEADTLGATEIKGYNRLDSERVILDYFFRQNWGYYIYALIIGLAYFIWVMFNFIKMKSASRDEVLAEKETLKHLRVPPVIAAFIVLMNTLPFFNFNAPPLVMQCGQLLLIGFVSVFFARQFPYRAFFHWLILVIGYILFLFANNYLVSGFTARLLLLSLNLGAIFGGYIATRGILPYVPFPKLTQAIRSCYILLNLVAIAANILGRVTVAKLCGITAIFSMVQMILLSVFIECITEAFELQRIADRLQKRSAMRLELLSRLQNGVFRILVITACIAWTIAFSINLNIYDLMYDGLVAFLTHQVKIGSVSFRVGNVVVFVVIVYISNLLQKYIGFLYGPGLGKQVVQTGRRGSRLVMIRLILVIGGFLFAIVASGLPLDRITIVLGALGVGIGLGLQNIVNNLVSGIILVFERPFQIGDFIELNGKKGIVRDMGIRASKLVTEEGTEIIMPNGDLLSGEVINWTIQNSQVRVEIPLTVESGHPYEEISQIVEQTLKDHPDLSKADPPRVLLNTSTDKTSTFTVLAWVANIGQIQTIKSEVFRLLVQKLRERQIKTM